MKKRPILGLMLPLSLALLVVVTAFISIIVEGKNVYAATFTDDFSSGINPAHWTVSPGAYTIDDTQGDIRISKPVGPGAWARVAFRHEVRGDFDISVDYRDANLAGCQNQIQLNLSFGGQYVADRREKWCEDRYSVWLDPPRNTVGVKSTTDTSGTLRVTRVGSVVTFFANGTQIYQGTFNNSPVVDLWLSLQNNGSSDAISVTFDNFSIIADSIIATDDKVLAALNFNNGNYVRVEDSASLDITDAITLEAWVYKTGDGEEWNMVISKPWDGDWNPWHVYRMGITNVVPKKAICTFALSTGYAAIMGTSAIPNNTWTHLACTYDGSTMKIYVNGVLENSAAA